jgi:hypothetical protein
MVRHSVSDQRQSEDSRSLHLPSTQYGIKRHNISLFTAKCMVTKKWEDRRSKEGTPHRHKRNPKEPTEGKRIDHYRRQLQRQQQIKRSSSCVVHRTWTSQPTPSTYVRGTECMDYIYVSHDLLQCIQSVNYLPFPTAYSTDHRPIQLPFNMKSLIQTSLDSINLRKRS